MNGERDGGASEIRGVPEEWTFDHAALADFDRAEALEWLETNGVGGWASSTASGANSRRYHGLLVAALDPPVARRVLLSRLDETVSAGEASVELGVSRFVGAIHPRGHERIERFRRGVFPVWEYRAAGVSLRKTVAGIDGENTTAVLYEVLESPGPFELALRPFFAARDYHALAVANDVVRRDAELCDDVLRYRPYDGLPEIRIALRGARWVASPDWWYGFEYVRERERGLDHREDLFTPGALHVRLGPGARLGVLATIADPGGRDAFAMVEAERRRRQVSVDRGSSPAPLCRALAGAADAFVVRRGEDLRTVVAGYPWFTDWGRDAMIALPGLTLVTGRHDDARAVLRAFAAQVDDGMLPNRFPDRGQAPEYNTADASLWFFVATERYRATTGDAAFVRDAILPVLREIVAGHRRGTRYGIAEAPDGLLHVGEAGAALTWMDAKVGNRPVTPRIGFPVEVQALWINALAILAGLERDLGDPAAAAAPAAAAERARRRFAALFWNPADGCLFDVVDGDRRDGSIRPNQILALALPHPILDRARSEAVLRVVERRLLTPVGLRSLDPADPAYRGTYSGGAVERDGAYHQGTVWPWLLGPYLTALVRVRGAAGRARGLAILDRFVPHLGEAGIGTVSEVFDGDPPHRPGGCIAQAWSVAEILRAAIEDLGLGAAPPA